MRLVRRKPHNLHKLRYNSSRLICDCDIFFVSFAADTHDSVRVALNRKNKKKIGCASLFVSLNTWSKLLIKNLIDLTVDRLSGPCIFLFSGSAI